MRIRSAQVKIHQILVIFERTNQFFFEFCITPKFQNINHLYFFNWNFIYIQKKGAYQSKNLVKFYASSRKSENLHFDEFLWSKVWARKVQKSYLSRHWRVIQNLKKVWSCGSNMTWGIWWIFTQSLKSLKISFQWALFVQSKQGLSSKNTEEIPFMTLNSDAKFE